MTRLFLCILFMVSISTNLEAQTSRPHKGSQKKSAAKPVPKAPTITVDTAAVDYGIVTVMPIDTVQKDTSGIGQVAQEIHDSLKAQIKAPIVQVPVTLKSLIIPGALFAYGAITLNNGSLRKINEEAREVVWDGTVHEKHYEDYVLLIPAFTVYALNIAGIKGQNNLIDRSVIYGMSNLIANGIVFGVKNFGIEERPDKSDQYSFPSGHTAEAFVSAEFLHQEYKGRIHWSVIAAGYAVGVGTAYMRMYHNKHWLSDVVAGAGIGMASTRFSYYLYPIIKHVLFGSKKVKQDAMIMPTYKSGGGYGLALTYRF